MVFFFSIRFIEEGVFFQGRKNLEVLAKNVKFLVYLEFKCLLGDSSVEGESTIKSERLKKKI